MKPQLSSHAERSSKRRRSSPSKRAVPDIRKWIIPAFIVMLVLEIGLGTYSWNAGTTNEMAVNDQKRLVRVGEAIDQALDNSIALGRVSFQATSSADARLVAEYRKELIGQNPPATENLQIDFYQLNPLNAAKLPLSRMQSPGIFFGKPESLRYDQIASEYENLLRLDERVIAYLEGRFEDEDGALTLQKEPDPEAARAVLRDNSYQARRSSLNEDLKAMQATLDVRRLALLNLLSDTNKIYFPVSYLVLWILAIGTGTLGWFLYRHLEKSITTYKTQIRKMNDEMSRILGQVSSLERERNELSRRLESKSQTSESEAAPPPPPPPVIRQAPVPSREIPPPAPEYNMGSADELITRLP